jgi:hypothetical protein
LGGRNRAARALAGELELLDLADDEAVDERAELGRGFADGLAVGQLGGAKRRLRHEISVFPAVPRELLVGEQSFGALAVDVFRGGQPGRAHHGELHLADRLPVGVDAVRLEERGGVAS